MEVCQKQLDELDSAIEEGFRFLSDPTLASLGDKRIAALQITLVDMEGRKTKLTAILADFATKKAEIRQVLHILKQKKSSQAEEEIRIIQKQDEDITKRQIDGERLLLGANERLSLMGNEMANLLLECKKELKTAQLARIHTQTTLNRRLNSILHQIKILSIQRTRKELLAQLNLF